MKNVGAISYWVGKGYKHQFSIVFTDGTFVDVDMSSRQAAQQVLETAQRPTCIGFITSSQADKNQKWSGAVWGEMVDQPSDRYIGNHLNKKDAATAVVALYFNMRAEADRFATDPVYALEERLKKHDWYAHYSDDFSIVEESDRNWQEIRRLMTKVEAHVASELLQRYKPADR